MKMSKDLQLLYTDEYCKGSYKCGEMEHQLTISLVENNIRPIFGSRYSYDHQAKMGFTR